MTFFGDLPRKPNILLIITDQEREVMHWPDGWAEGNLPARSRLLSHGLQFTRAQCNAAACSASRATLMTGLYPTEHGVKNLVTSDDPDDDVQRHLQVLPSRLPNLAAIFKPLRPEEGKWYGGGRTYTLDELVDHQTLAYQYDALFTV